MVAWVESILGTPLPTLLVVAGLVFLGVAIMGQVSGRINPGREGRVMGASVGAVLLTVGLVMSLGLLGPVDDGSPTTEVAQLTATSTPVVEEAEGREAATAPPADPATDPPTDPPTAPPTDPPARQLSSEDCLPFLTDAVTVQADGDRWLLTDGRSRMLVFDVRSEADRTLRIVREYGLNDRCFVGRPGASLSYWLADDRAPTGALSDEDCVSFDPENLEIREGSERFFLLDGRSSLVAFPNEEEASTARAIIRHHGFTEYCFVGRPDPSMTYLRR